MIRTFTNIIGKQNYGQNYFLNSKFCLELKLLPKPYNTILLLTQKMTEKSLTLQTFAKIWILWQGKWDRFLHDLVII